MRQRPKSPKSKGKLPVAAKSPKNQSARVRDLEKRLAEALKDKAEAVEQQTATSEILRVIASSPTDTQPVFDAITESAARLCGVADGWIVLTEGDTLRGVSAVGQLVGQLPVYNARRIPLTRESVIGRAILDRTTIHIDDLAAASEVEYPEGRALQRMLGHRTQLVTPLLREGVAIGAILLARFEVRLFSERQIELLKTFADQAVIAIENVRLFRELEARNRDLTTALDQQTATSEILRVISQSPTDVRPVFDTIVESVVQLFNGVSATVYQFDGDLIHLIAHYHSVTSAARDVFERVYPLPPSRTSVVAQAILDRVVIHVRDFELDPDIPLASREMARAVGHRSLVAVPMLRDHNPIGAISVGRRGPQGAPRPFSDSEIAVLQTFADQAVIAIENVRLFNETKEALEQQTATADILRVISGSPTDVQPVFDTIVRSAAKLCRAYTTAVFLTDGRTIHHPANHGGSPEALAAVRARFPRPLDMESTPGTAILTRSVVHIPDTEDPSVPEHVMLVAAALGFRSVLTVPMLRESEAVGAITVARREPGRFSDAEVALLQTFADQAVIAIENVRLFKELEARNRDLTEALDQQTATSEILGVISQSQTDVQPVFDAILSSAIRLMGAQAGVLTRITGDCLELAAFKSTDDRGEATIKAAFPLSLQSDGVHAKAIRDRSPVNIAEAQSDARLRGRTIAHAVGYQSLVAVPMILQDVAVGTISATRREPGGFTDEEIALLKTFADQAVIAIENVRLFTELQTRTAALTRSVDQLTALGEVGRAVSSTLDLETVLTTIVARAVQLTGLDGGVVFEYDEAAEELIQRAVADPGGILPQARRGARYKKGEGALGRAAITLEPVQVTDITVPGAYDSKVRENLIASGVRAILAVPMVHQGRLIGCLGVTRNLPGDFPTETIELLRTFATQSALAIQNARLFREIEAKSHQLETVSQHKSEFLANMSHELRTPLNAIIGFSEVLSERMFGELNEKQDEYLKDIYASGTHLLSLINDILDLSKIEAGRMDLELTDFDLPTAIDNALMLVRERAGRRSITVQMSVDERLGEIRADERKIRQVVLNLLSNAIKFTPEGGRIEVGAMPKDGFVEVSVSDTGVGIAPEDQEAVFEEFRQVGTAEKKAEGTGLGLTLCRKFIELHGGRIWVKSQVGSGSTFTFTIPVRREE